MRHGVNAKGEFLAHLVTDPVQVANDIMGDLAEKEIDYAKANGGVNSLGNLFDFAGLLPSPGILGDDQYCDLCNAIIDEMNELLKNYSKGGSKE